MFCGDIDEGGVAHELQVPAAGGGDLEAVRSQQVLKLSTCPTARIQPSLRGLVVVRELGVDRVGQVSSDGRDDDRKLDRDGDVMDEVDQHEHVGKDQRQRHGHRDLRDERAALVPTADCSEGQDRVHERCHEGPQRQLSTEVTDEVTKHPRAELLRGEGEGDDGHGEDHPEHRDDAGGERAEQLTRAVGTLDLHPGGQRVVFLIDVMIDLIGREEKTDRGEQQDQRNDPQCCSQCLSSPRRKQGEGTHRQSSLLGNAEPGGAEWLLLVPGEPALSLSTPGFSRACAA